MSQEQIATLEAHACDAPSASRPGGHRTRKLALLVAAIVFSLAAFLFLDWLRTAAVRRKLQAARSDSCRVADRVRHHALRPDCISTEHWGKDSYELVTNSLGFRDERIRQVPLTDPRPRILLLGDSFTEGMIAWRDSYAGRLAAHFPQYDFLNGGVSSYSPSNYLNVTRMLLAAGVQVDEVIVFIDISDVHDEAAFYRDADRSGAVTRPKQELFTSSWYGRMRSRIAKYFLLTDGVFEFGERILVGRGYYHFPRDYGDMFDTDRLAWTYRTVDQSDPYPAGFAPLGLEGGITKAKAKMDLLWQELARRNIRLSIVVYPYPAQIAHDTADSSQVRIWREWCQGKCKRFISVFPPFFAAKEQCLKSRPGCWYLNYFIFGDSHYNAAGNALVADAVIASLTQEPPARRSGKPPQDEAALSSPVLRQ